LRDTVQATVPANEPVLKLIRTIGHDGTDEQYLIGMTIDFQNALRVAWKKISEALIVRQSTTQVFVTIIIAVPPRFEIRSYCIDPSEVTINNQNLVRIVWKAVYFMSRS
jgi:hypothetical protein